MTSRLLSLVPAAVIGGTVLLTACGQGDLPTGAPSTPPNRNVSEAPVKPQASANWTAASNSSAGGAQSVAGGDTGGEGNVNCGPVRVPNGSVAEYSLIADETPDGIVGCTEAFNVLAEYLETPPDLETGGSQGNADLSNGWSCSTDGGSGPSAEGNIYCSNGEDNGHGGTTGGLALHTEAA